MFCLIPIQVVELHVMKPETEFFIVTSITSGDQPSTLEHDAALFDSGFEGNQAPSIWCLSCYEGLIVAGCGNGRLEVFYLINCNSCYSTNKRILFDQLKWL